ncbi:hypothetical protein CS078_01710 [Pseudomonas prosekii]|uniref:Uncharacterized protein n=1 Tax=Pseudomonas prosekii TaxID=1148509 RepID=A0A3L8CHF0_9PSED|nr:hypothetical protein CS076_19565 [Pseudomonas prosekii]RLU12442.1 hypothetical protein CS078_01710 [Pseudomonas prosekii]
MRYNRVNHSSIQVCRRIAAGGTFVQVPRYAHTRYPIIRNFAERLTGSRRIRSLGQELSCLNPVPGSPHS